MGSFIIILGEAFKFDVQTSKTILNLGFFGCSQYKKLYIKKI